MFIYMSLKDIPAVLQPAEDTSIYRLQVDVKMTLSCIEYGRRSVLSFLIERTTDAGRMPFQNTSLCWLFYIFLTVMTHDNIHKLLYVVNAMSSRVQKTKARNDFPDSMMVHNHPKFHILSSCLPVECICIAAECCYYAASRLFRHLLRTALTVVAQVWPYHGATSTSGSEMILKGLL